MKSDATAGRAHPMKLKKDLARKIVSDFHSAQAAQQAEEDWAKQFQRDEVPEDVERVEVNYADVAAGGNHADAVKLDKLLARTGLASSVSDGLRKIKQNAVRVDNEVRAEQILKVKVPAEITVRVGRLLKKISIQ